jgi:hypothetical protein
MATENGNKVIYWVVGAVALLGIGVGVYFILKNKKNKENTNKKNNNTNQEVNPNSDVKSNGEVTDDSEVKPNKDITPDTNGMSDYKLNSPAKIKAFQDWMDSQGKAWVRDKNGKYGFLKKGAGYGNLGENTKKVWVVYGKEYIKSLK